MKFDDYFYARRSAIDLLTHVTLDHPSTSIDPVTSFDPSSVMRTCYAMEDVCSDTDWEVKREIVEFWRRLLKIDDVTKSFGEVVKTETDTDAYAALKASFVFCMKELLNDHDRVVRLEACKLLKSLQQSCNLEQDTHTATKRLRPTNRTLDELMTEIQSSKYTCTLADLLQVQLDEAIEEAGRSDDQYSNDPISLLDDLVRALALAEVEMQSNVLFDGADESLVDCY